MDKIAMDLTIRLGDVITMIGLLAGGAMVVLMMRADMKILSTRVGSVEKTVDTFSKVVEQKFDGITQVLIEQGKHDQRIQNIENRIQEITGPASARIQQRKS